MIFDQYDGFGAARLRFMEREWRLTPRQSQVLAHLVQGAPNKDIATKLGCAMRTVEVHVAAILRKARAESRAQLVALFWGRQ